METHNIFIAILKAAFLLFLLMDGSVNAQTFRYVRTDKMPGAVGICPRGLTQLPNGNWLTSPKSGNFELVEFSGTSVIRNHGSINADNKLNMAGRPLAQVRGLLAEGDTVLCSFGSFYANGANTNFLCRVRLTDPLTVESVYSVPATIHSDTVKGCVLPADCAMRTLTGKTHLAFGSRGSTAQGQSWGIGLVAVTPGESAERLIHWPMKTVNKVSFSDFPRDPADGPTIWMQPNFGTVVETYGQCDSVTQVVDIGESFVFTGTAALGRTWYGLKTDYQTWPSAIDPTKPCIGVNSPHGLHAEGYRAKYWLISKRDVFTGKAYTSVGNLRDLGGSVPLQSSEVSGVWSDGKTLMAIDPSPGNSAAQIHIWEVTQ